MLVEQVRKSKNYAPKGQIVFNEVPKGTEIKCDITQEIIPSGEIYYIVYGSNSNRSQKLFISKRGKDILERTNNEV